jgi:hypothetical protein
MKKLVTSGLVFLFIFLPVLCPAGIIEIYSEPTGAKVYVDNEYVGNTPYQNFNMRNGQHIVKVELTKEWR